MYLRDSLWNHYSSTITYDPATMTATITDATLPYATDLELKIFYRVTDLAGNTMVDSYSGWFKTVCDPNAPTIISSDPAQYATGIPVDVNPTFTFDADMNPDTLNAANISVGYGVSSYTGIDGTFSYEAATRTLTFTPSAPLPSGVWITVYFREDVADTAGRHVCYSESNPMVVSFETEGHIARDTGKFWLLVLPAILNAHVH